MRHHQKSARLYHPRHFPNDRWLQTRTGFSVHERNIVRKQKVVAQNNIKRSRAERKRLRRIPLNAFSNADLLRNFQGIQSNIQGHGFGSIRLEVLTQITDRTPHMQKMLAFPRIDKPIHHMKKRGIISE